MALVNYTLSLLKGRSIKDISFAEDASGYQHFKLTLDDGTQLDAFENQQAGEVALTMDGHRIAPCSEFDAPVPDRHSGHAPLPTIPAHAGGWLTDDNVHAITNQVMEVPIINGVVLQDMLSRGAVFRDALYAEPDQKPDQKYYLVVIGRTPRLKVLVTPPVTDCP